MSRFKRDYLHLSPPDIGDTEAAGIIRALRSGWVAPLGPEVDAFEREIAAFTGRAHAVALASGTAALHLAYKHAGVTAGSEVVVPTLTFGATAFPVEYLGAHPIFTDVDPESWTIDLELLADLLERRATSGRMPAAIVAVDLFGVPCNYSQLLPLAAEYGIPVIADAAEALGADCEARPAGSFGESAVLSFNGNKIITTSGGGMYLTDDADAAAKVRYWATQSREPQPWYEHVETGYNYRLSNLLAAVGRAQLERLPSFVVRRREIRALYTVLLSTLPAVTVMADPNWGESNAWLTTIQIDPEVHPNGPTRVRLALEEANIESRPIWKPMHQQPLFQGAKHELTGVADRAFRDGLCLPSGTKMTDEDVERVVEVLIRALA